MCRSAIIPLIALLLFASCRENNPRPRQRMELLWFDGRIDDFDAQLPAPDPAMPDKYPGGELYNLTYIFIDTGMIICRIRTTNDSLYAPDTVWFCSANYLARPPETNNSIIVYDDAHPEVNSLYIVQKNKDTAVLYKSEQLLPAPALSLVNALGHAPYEGRMAAIRKNIFERIDLIHRTMDQHTIFPRLLFCPPVIKKDEEIKD